MSFTALLSTKHDFTDIYNHPTCVRYHHEILTKMTLKERHEISSKYAEKYLLPMFRKWAHDLGKPLKFLDFLSSFGNDTLVFTNCFYMSDFDKMWSSEETCFTLSKPRQYPVETWATDLSESALLYGKKAGIFDEIMPADLNKLTADEEEIVKNRCISSNILHINCFTYLTDEIPGKLMDWFAMGSEPGMLIAGFINPYDGVERTGILKQMLLSRFSFINSITAHNRLLDEPEGAKYGAEYGTWNRSYYETWFLTRNI